MRRSEEASPMAVAEAHASAARGPHRARRPGVALVEGEVPFHDVDALGIAWHGHYYKYLEVARTALFRRHAVDGPDLLSLGFHLVIVDSHCRHSAPLRYGDRYEVAAWFLDLERRVHVSYEVRNATSGVRAARGRTVLVTMDGSGRMLHETPAEVKRRILG